MKKTSDQEHVVMQLRKNISMNGSKPITFADGNSQTVKSGDAQKVLDHYNSYRKTTEKEAFQKHEGATHRNLTDWLGGKKFTPEQVTTKPVIREVNNDEIFGHESIRESSTLRTVKSLRHLKEVEERKIERAKFRPRLADIVASV